MKTKSLLSIMSRFVVLAAAFTVAFVFSKLGPLLDLCTALTVTSTMVFFPISFRMTLMAKKQGSFGAALSQQGISLVWQIVMLVVAIYGTIKGIGAGIDELRSP